MSQLSDGYHTGTILVEDSEGFNDLFFGLLLVHSGCHDSAELLELNLSGFG